MPRQSVVVTYKINEARRAILSEILGDDAKLFFLADLPSRLREQRLVEANVLLSWNLPKELGPSEFSLLEKNVVGSPHNSAMVPGTSDEAARRAVVNIKRFLKQEPFVGVIRREDYV